MAHDRSIAHIAYEANDISHTAAAIRALRGNIFLLAWWPLILKREFLALGQDVTLNLHPSLLPHARGKDPNFWTIVEECPFGVSIHHVTPDIDAGDIAFQREIPSVGKIPAKPFIKGRAGHCRTVPGQLPAHCQLRYPKAAAGPLRRIIPSAQ
jgi:methionyl-tRNA formyltransferase